MQPAVILKAIMALGSVDDLIKIKNFVTKLIRKKKSNVIKRTKVNMMLDVAFEIETTKTFDELTQQEILEAIMLRTLSLARCWDKDAIGFNDQYEMEEEP